MSNAVAKMITTDALIKKGGGTPDKQQPVTFKGHQFNAPHVHLKDPLASKAIYSEEIDAMYEAMTHTEEFAYGFNDVAVNLHRVMLRLDGGVVRSTRTGMKMPSERTVEVGFGDDGNMQYVTVPEDRMTVPGFKAQVRAIENKDGSGSVEFVFHRYEHDAIKGILGYLREALKENSIYRGQVINQNYEYIDVTGFDISKVVYNEDIGDLLNTWCVSTLRNGEANEAAGLQTKVSACLAGRPGTGKTMFIAMARKICFGLGGTTVCVSAGSGIGGFTRGLNILRTYMEPGVPALLTFEDIEGLRAHERSQLLELFDGATSKTDRALMLTTTNTPEVLEPALLRPGRIDMLIPVDLPDLGAFTRLLQIYLGDMLDPECDFEEAFKAFDQYTSAWIVGAGEVVIRGAIARTGTHEGLVITTRDLITAANGYRPQFEMQNRSANRVEELPTLDRAMQQMVYEAMDEVVNDYSFATSSDNTDYDMVTEAADSAIESRLDGATVQDADGENGKLYTK